MSVSGAPASDNFRLYQVHELLQLPVIIHKGLLLL
jgi:hypothetical protein